MSKNILVVDDEPDVIRLMQMSLEKAGYCVTTAENGQQALDSIAKAHPDLILIDTIMPVMNGLETVRELKGNVATAKIPVVMLTANDSEDDMSKGWESGTDLYLTKPILAAELLEFIRCILA